MVICMTVDCKRVVYINGESSSKQQNRKFEIIWFYNYRVLKNHFNKPNKFLTP